jgi:hypothetical protein
MMLSLEFLNEYLSHNWFDFSKLLGFYHIKRLTPS